MFKRRGVEIFAPELDKVFDSTEFSSVLFRDSQLKNGSKLILREPARQKLEDNGDVVIESEEESDMEGGEDEEKGRTGGLLHGWWRKRFGTGKTGKEKEDPEESQ